MSAGDKGAAGHQSLEPVGPYESFPSSGRLLALSAISSARDGKLVTGKVGRDLDLASGQAEARNAAENLLAVLRRRSTGIYRGSSGSCSSTAT